MEQNNNLKIINLNQISKIVLVKTKRIDKFCWEETCSTTQWFKNLFKKHKIKQKYISSNSRAFNSIEEFNEKEKDLYYCNPQTGKFYEKPHIVMWYGDYNHYSETRYFETDKEAKEYFEKINTYAQKHNVPFINFYSE